MTDKPEPLTRLPWDDHVLLSKADSITVSAELGDPESFRVVVAASQTPITWRLTRTKAQSLADAIARAINAEAPPRHIRWDPARRTGRLVKAEMVRLTKLPWGEYVRLDKIESIMINAGLIGDPKSWMVLLGGRYEEITDSRPDLYTYDQAAAIASSIAEARGLDKPPAAVSRPKARRKKASKR